LATHQSPAQNKNMYEQILLNCRVHGALSVGVLCRYVTLNAGMSDFIELRAPMCRISAMYQASFSFERRCVGFLRGYFDIDVIKFNTVLTLSSPWLHFGVRKRRILKIFNLHP
jgi:hypothetical protein